MNIADIYEAVYLCNADTLMAYAFRKAVGCPQHKPVAKLTARVDRYADAGRLMGQRHGVRGL